MSGVIRQVSMLKWGQNNKSSTKTPKTWIHPPDALQSGHVVYVVKFLGCTEVEQAKGIEVVKESIRKLKFNQQLKKAEGTKVPKVELVVSVDGVAIQDPKTKITFHQYPLHLISYCADDKSDKKFFSFIAKKPDSEKHVCFVFNSEKLAEDITLTIGQAFDLAYRKFLETTGRDLEIRKQLSALQKKVEVLEAENENLRKKLKDLESGQNETGTDRNITEHIRNEDLSPPLRDNFGFHSSSPADAHNENPSTAKITQPSQDLFDLVFPPVSPQSNNPNDILVDSDFDPREESICTNGNAYSKNDKQTDLFGAEPFNPGKPSNSLFGMDDFTSVLSNKVAFENMYGNIDKNVLEMNDGFSRGLSFGNDDFSLYNLEPCQKNASQ